MNEEEKMDDSNKDDSNNDEEVLMSLRKTRKSLTTEYFCAIFLLLLLLISSVKGLVIKANIKYFIFGLALFSFVSAELSRYFVNYKITPKKVITTNGIIKQTKKNIYFHPLGFVTDINVKQDRIQRILNYGTVYVKSASGDNSLEIKDVDRPHEVLEMIENLIKRNRLV
ncbi:MAG: PH domain-containing protein [Nanoarchaeota archaeon]|nr:PH domain-containing protein [Nanoarchaeota archaeon]MBU1631731.1 PH domain-containing protein [Nanoarchaeota archaeon]MBU1875874.1 PH domain-containing protein [Nanoarchaeota archaeon]